MATWNSPTGTFADISAVINGGTDSLGHVWGANDVADGDTVNIPSGTWTWTNSNGIAISKGITLHGNTTVTGDHTAVATGASVDATSNGVAMTGTYVINVKTIIGAGFATGGGRLLVRSTVEDCIVSYTSFVSGGGGTTGTFSGCTTVKGSGNLGTNLSVAQSGQTVNDQTIIIDNLSGPGGKRSASNLVIFNFALQAAAQACRLTGCTFKSADGVIAGGSLGFIRIGNITANPLIANVGCRIDNCHFELPNMGHHITVSGWIYGVHDHCVHECYGGDGLYYIQSGQNWNTQQIAGGQDWGHGSWADYPWFGSNKFWFIEDCTIQAGGGNTSSTGAVIDGKYGSRVVSRYNNLVNGGFMGGHGTEDGVTRGIRAREFYGNSIIATHSTSTPGNRSGTMMYHDNTWLGSSVPPGNNQPLTVTVLRQSFSSDPFGPASGQESWDQNAFDLALTTPVAAGDPGTAFYSTTNTLDSVPAPSTGTNPSGGTGTVTISPSPGWSTDQWVGKWVTNLNINPIYTNGKTKQLSGLITGNSSNQLTYVRYGSSDHYGMVVKAGDHIVISGILNALDQPGTGKGDRLSGDNNTVTNVDLGGPIWPRNAVEPIMEWNNKQGSTYFTGIGGSNAYPTFKSTAASNVGTPGSLTVANMQKWHAISFGNVSTANAQTVIPDAQRYYVAARNGQDYISEYTYPYASGGQTLPDPPVITSATARSAIVGIFFSYTITATNSPTSFNVGVLPAGLSLSGAVISGTPVGQPGTYNIDMTATNSGGTSPTVTLVLTLSGDATTQKGKGRSHRIGAGARR